MAASPPPVVPPGVGTARRLAILALGFALLSIGLVWLALDPETHSYPVLAILASTMFLLTVPLALAAVFLGSKARPWASHESKSCRPPGRLELKLGLVSIGIWVLVLAMVVPLLARNGRGRARDRAALMNLEEGLRDLASAYGEASRKGLAEEQCVEAMEQLLEAGQDRRNPWDRSLAGWRPGAAHSGPGEVSAKAAAEQQATVPGQVVFVLAERADSVEPRWLAGAVLTRTLEPSSGSPRVITKTRQLGP